MEAAMSGNMALVVDRRGAALELGTHGTLVLRFADGRRERVGLHALGAVVLHGDVQISTGVLQALAAAGAGISVSAVVNAVVAWIEGQAACRLTGMGCSVGFSGLRWTTSMRVQFRVAPDHRLGWRSLAAA